MNFEQNTGKSIQQAFEEYHKLNPQVYKEFEKRAFEAIKKGKTKISFKLILNVIRWEKYMQTVEPTLFNQNGDQIKFKINDAYGSRYARMFIQNHPKHADKIELRELRA